MQQEVGQRAGKRGCLFSSDPDKSASPVHHREMGGTGSRKDAGKPPVLSLEVGGSLYILSSRAQHSPPK